MDGLGQKEEQDAYLRMLEKQRNAIIGGWVRNSIFSTCRKRRPHGVLASEGLGDLARGRAVHASCLPGQRLPRSALPQILDRSLWRNPATGKNYKELMFTTESEKHDYAIKPMNAPATC